MTATQSDHRNDDQRSLGRFLARRPDDLADLRMRLPDEIPRGPALLRLHRNEYGRPAQDEQPDHPQEQRLVGPVVEPGDSTCENGERTGPLGQIGDRCRCLHARSHRLPDRHVTRCRSSPRDPNPVCGLDHDVLPARTAPLAGQEGIEPPTCGFGDRRSAC